MNLIPLLLLACQPAAVINADEQPADSAPPADTQPPGGDDTQLPGDDTQPPGGDTGDPVETLPDDTDEATVEDVGSPADLEIIFEPAGGGFTDTLTLTLSAAIEGAQIRYTVDGSLPDEDSALVYEGPITLSASAVVRAYAVAESGTGQVGAAAYARLAPGVADFTSDLPVLILHSDQPAPEYDTGAHTPFALNVFEPPEGGRAAVLGEADVSTRAGLKVRGSSSAGYPKHPYALETVSPGSDDDQDIALLGMPPEGDWVMYAPLNFDRALMRNALIYGLSNAIGRYAPRTRFAEVFLAGSGQDVTLDHYVGVYVITERIERDADRVAITRLEPEDVEEPEVTGGYIFKRDRLGAGEGGFTAGDVGGTFSFAQPLVYVYPEEEDIASAQAGYLADSIDAFGLALSRSDGLHPGTGQHYSELIDVDSWIDHHVLNVLSKNPDAFRLSGYFHKDREGPIHSGPVWDFDRTMYCSSDSRADDPENWDATNVTSDTTDVFDHGWWRGLFDDEDFRDAYRDRWLELLDGELSVKNLHSRVDEMAAELDEAADRNFDRWDDYPPRGGSFESEVQILKDWLEERHLWISACLTSDLPDFRDCGR